LSATALVWGYRAGRSWRYIARVPIDGKAFGNSHAARPRAGRRFLLRVRAGRRARACPRPHARLQCLRSPKADGDRPARANAQPLAKQSCDRDYNTCKEPADAAEHQNIVDFGHGVPTKAPARASRGSKSMRLRSSSTTGCQMPRTIRHLCFSAIACVEEFGFVALASFCGDRKPTIGPPCQWRGRGGKERSPARSCSVRAGWDFAIMTREAPRRSSRRVQASCRRGTSPHLG
jgi:hypothetical protein